MINSGSSDQSFVNTICISETQREEIERELEINRKLLIDKGILHPSNNKSAAVKFDWPLRLRPGLTYPSFWGISNFVDHNLGYPNEVQDYNCGTRTYDQSSGYNHSGTDIFLWPFKWLMVSNADAEVIAAAPGTILLKIDGNYDHNCSLNGTLWNAVYIQHSDGTVAWYGHMKAYSLTSKNIGESVVAGERLGAVGSSGNSTGPHLHFEVHNTSNQVIDPWAGTCNNIVSMWNLQRGYYDPYINRVMTHSALPSFPACPGNETTNEKTVFQPGDQLITITYLRDQQTGQTINYKLYDPLGVYYSWSNTFTSNPTANYWYYTFILPGNANQGTWIFEAKMNGQTATANFQVGTATGIQQESNAEIFHAYFDAVAQQIHIRMKT
jgi:murein DD-endopeptidase MepM/ murein hydrolase activator NlpD